MCRSARPLKLGLHGLVAAQMSDLSSRPKEPNFEAARLAAHVRRRELGLTLIQLVERCQLAESTVTGVLYGYHDGSVRTWWAIARGLDLPVGALLNHLDESAETTTLFGARSVPLHDKS